MKHYFSVVLVCAFLFAGCSSSKTYSDIINDFRQADGSEYVSIPTALLKAGTAMLPKGDISDLARSINSVRILNLSNCSDRVKKRFIHALSNANDTGYEPFVSTNGKYEQTRVLTRSDDDYVREILIASAEYGSCDIVQVMGKIKMEDVQKVIDANIDKIRR